MTNYKVTDTELISIADAIRLKGGTSASLEFPSGFVSAISAISGGGVTPTYGSKTILENGEYDPATDGFDAFSHVTVSVPSGSSPVLVSKTINENGTYNPADDSADAYSQVVVSVAGGSVIPLLPSEYQEVEYVETDGSAYCNILFQPLKSDILNFSVYVTPDTTNGEQGFIGYSDMWELYAQGSSLNAYASISMNTINYVKGSWYSISAIFSGSVTSSFYYGRYKSKTYPFYGRLNTLTIKEARGNNILLKLIPCYRKSDSVIGFYDVFHSSFYSNYASGSFGKGADVTG